MESLLQLMKCRRSVRKFQDRPVPQDIMIKILEAASVAPSGAGVGGTHIIVIDDPDVRRKLRKICDTGEKEWVNSQPASVRERILKLPGYSFQHEYLESAPLLLVVTTRPRDPEVPYAVESAFLAVGYMLVMIEGLGLGTVTYTPSITQEKDSRILNQLLNLPEGEAVQVILPIGYPEKKPTPKLKSGFYNVYHNSFGEKFKGPAPDKGN